MHPHKEVLILLRNKQQWLFTCATICKFLEGIMLGEQVQSQSVTCCVIHSHHIWKLRSGEQTGPCRGWCGGDGVTVKASTGGLCGHGIALCRGHGGGDTHIHLRDQHSTAGHVTAFSCKYQPHSHCNEDMDYSVIDVIRLLNYTAMILG